MLRREKRDSSVPTLVRFLILMTLTANAFGRINARPIEVVTESLSALATAPTVAVEAVPFADYMSEFPGVGPEYAPEMAPSAAAPIETDSTTTTTRDFSEGETYIVTLSQTDGACPSERSCPGPDALDRACGHEDFANFLCESSWTSGLAGLYFDEASGTNTVEAILLKSVEDHCPGCSHTMNILTIRDSPLSSTLTL